MTGQCQIVNKGPAQPFRSGPIRKRPARREETALPYLPTSDDSARSAFDFVEIVDKTEELAMQHVAQVCFGGVKDMTESEREPGQEVAKDADIIAFIYNGEPANRIDIVLMGDGYTADDREDYEADMNRLVSEMWAGDTFKHILPLMNVWGIFAPGADRGIGVGGKPKNTPFGLYRDGTELRGIYCSKPFAARKACKLTGPGACDYPSLIGNDDFYGGLGGEFVISTRSNVSGTVVMRHELGHNLVHVGEEYDGGQVYSGCNSERSLKTMKWEKWLTDPHVVEQRSVVRVQDYSWYDLSKGAYSIHFRSDGAYQRWQLKISASGVESNDAMHVYLDGESLGWISSGNLDRGFYEWVNDDEGLSDGDHTLVFELGTPPEKDAPIRQLCSVSLVELGSEEEYNSVESSCVDGRTNLHIKPLPLAQFRESGDLGRHVEWYTVRWYTRPAHHESNRGAEQDESTDEAEGGLRVQAASPDDLFFAQRKDHWRHAEQLDDLFTAEVEPGLWKVEVRFHTVDVKVDHDDVLRSTWHGRVDKTC
ncbi:hypothetical protein HDU86_006889 [Geranomyces michiganensis]|nr:hypothetical protein HDU86_006889 [Geranomyces michiganensis]